VVGFAALVRSEVEDISPLIVPITQLSCLHLDLKLSVTIL